MTETKELEPIQPGEILAEEFLEPLDLGVNQLARDLDVPPGRISEILDGKRSITADIAPTPGALLRGLGSILVWLNLQTRYDLKIARRRLWPTIEARVPLRGAA